MNQKPKVLITFRSFSSSGVAVTIRLEDWAGYCQGYGLEASVVISSRDTHRQFYKEGFPDCRVLTFDYMFKNEMVPENLLTKLLGFCLIYGFLVLHYCIRSEKNDYYPAIEKLTESERL